MRIIVTGATGFIGACLVRRLLQEGREVHVFIRSSSNRWRITDIAQELREHALDLRDAAAVENAVRIIRPAIIYHCAAHGGYAGRGEPTAVLESNFIGTVNLITAGIRAGCGYFVNTGSSSEYGIKDGPMREQDVPEPLDDYGVSKAAATLFCRKEGASRHVPVATLRLFSPYGPWDDPKRLVPYAMKCLLRGETPKLSTPSSVRDYVFIDDVLDAYVQVVKQPFYGDVFNIGSGDQQSIGRVLDAIIAAVPGAPPPQWGAVERQRMEPVVWVADRSKARDRFGWQPRTPFAAGIARTVAWMQEHLAFYP